MLHVAAVLVPRVFPLKFGRERPEPEVAEHSSMIVSYSLHRHNCGQQVMTNVFSMYFPPTGKRSKTSLQLNCDR